MDPLGQGVSKEADSITFIGKTLPGERGTARLRKAKKGVRFAQLESLDNHAPNRITPSCEHFGQCPGCHYLHTDYQSELRYKKDALLRAVQKLPFEPGKLNVTPARQRSHYRNRIQLHYREDSIGLIDDLHDKVVQIPHCQIIKEELRPALDALYTTATWQESHKAAGHCELYFKNDSINVEWDKPYAHSGFTQVHEQTNTLLREHIGKLLEKAQSKSILDLFCGDGNLSAQYTKTHECKRMMIDAAATRKDDDFIQLDLFKDNALTKFRRDYQRNSFDVLLLDPPRKGFKNLPEWTQAFTPKQIIYVSCAPATLARDLALLTEHFSIESIDLMDMFPGTHHFETVVHLLARDSRKVYAKSKPAPSTT